MTTWFRPIVAAAAVLAAAPAAACPFCESEVGAQVHAGIFNAEFVENLLLVLLPFPILLALLVAVHFGLPWQGARARRASLERRHR